MTTTIPIMFIFVGIGKANAASYVLADANTHSECPSGSFPVADEATCRAIDFDALDPGASFMSTYSSSSAAPGCYLAAVGTPGAAAWNAHPVGDWSMTVFRAVCEVPPPTPAPTSLLSVSGDPILVVKGQRIKFDLPKGETLMWSDGLISIFAVADLTTPDGKNQWFSKFMLHEDGTKVAMVERQEIMSSQETTSAYGQTLSLVMFNHGVGTPAQLGSYDTANGAVRLTLKRGSGALGKFKQDVVSVNASSISLSISSARAKKYADEKQALKYSHLDLQIQRMESSVKAGLLAEFYGYVPMRRETAKLIRSVHV